MRTFALLRLSIPLIGIAMQGAAGAPLRVLFIGNSLTAANDVPALVEAIAKANGDRIVTRTIAYPDFSLDDQWQKGDAKRAMAEDRWSFVVLQQGPSALAESRVQLLASAKRFAKEASRRKTRIALFMVWPAASRAGDFDHVRLSYETAARETGGVFLPAGEAWRRAWALDPNLALYGPDGFHPSQIGSYLAALVIYQGLTGKSPTRSGVGFVSGAQARLLQHAAAQELGRAVQ